MRIRTRSVLATLLLISCMLGPTYRRRQTTPVATQWRDSTQENTDSSYANIPWWGVLGDTTLQTLVRRALEENRDLYVALARVDEARRLRRLNESALAALRDTEQERRAVIMTVVSEVARTYLEMLDFDGQVAIVEAQVSIGRQSLQLAGARFRGGLTSELDVRQGEKALALAEGTRANALRQRDQKENELSVLLGRPAGALPRGLPLVQQRFPETIPAGLPSSLLERRPDVRRAEEQLRAANARIGAAIAAMFPTVTLTASGGTASDDLDGLFKTGTGFTHIAANLLQPIINVDRNKHHVAAERARTEAAVGVYEKIVLTAFQEVEDGLVAVQRLREEAEAAGRAAAAARRSVALAGLRYEGGIDNYLNLLDAQRAELDAELHESELQRQHRVAVVQLYKALGGGWDPVTDTLALPPARVQR